MDDREKQIAEIRTAVLNLYNAVTETGQKISGLVRDVTEMKNTQSEIIERLEKVEKFFGNQNGKSEK